MKTDSAHDSMIEFMKSSLESLKTIRTQRIGSYVNVDDFVLQNGIAFQPTEFLEGYEWGEKQQCFMNAFQLCQQHPNLIYVEGVAAGLIPTNHAWCIDENGKVIDNTWRVNRNAYLGVPLNIEYVCEAQVRKETYGVIDDWMNEWPVLREDRSVWIHEKFK